MQHTRALGLFALCAVILAAISFAVVDVSIANANGCIGMSSPCPDLTMPPVAIPFAIVGTLALLASVLPAITWFVDNIHHSRHDADIENLSMAVARPVWEDDE